MPSPDVSFESAGNGDAEAISVMSRQIWQAHYRPHILTEGELEFFWQRAYRPDSIRSDMRNGSRYEWIRVDARPVGFMAYRAESEACRLHLGKLYLDPEFHGLGIGAMALARVLELAVAEGLREIYLYVFRQNLKAIRAYVKAGFVIARTEMTECGKGYRYDDFVMVRRVLPEAC